MRVSLGVINKIIIRSSFLLVFIITACVPIDSQINIILTEDNIVKGQEQSLSLIQDTSLSITLGATNEAGLDLNFIVVEDPANGTLTGTAPNLVYTPTASYVGVDRFTYKVNNSAVVKIYIIVLPLPNVAPNTPTSLLCTDTSPLALSTLNACDLTAAVPADADGDPVTYLNSGSTCADVVVDSSTGDATFTAPIKDATCLVNVVAFDGLLNSASVSSGTITGANRAPVAYPQVMDTDLDTAIAFTLNSGDPDGDAIVSYTVVDTPTHGVLSGTAPNLTYTPNNNYVGSDSFTFTVNDGDADSAVAATVSISVIPLPANMYFCPDSNLPTPDYLWANADNWYAESGCLTKMNRVPVDGDSVFVEGTTFTDQPAAISLAEFIGFAPSGMASETAHISIVGGGTLLVNGGYWYGTSDVNTTVTFAGSTENFGLVNGDAIFNGNSYNSYATGIISGNATFNGTSSNYSIVVGTATFNNSSRCANGDLQSDAYFYDSSHNSGCHIFGNATFGRDDSTDLTYNQGTVDGTAYFYGYSFNDATGSVGYGEFYDSTINVGNVISNAIFDNVSVNGDNTQTGTVGGDATFNGSSNNNSTGVVVGTITWGPGNPNLFAANSSIYFCDQGSGLWENHANWYRDSGCTTKSNRTPMDGDSVTIQVGIFTDTPAAISLAGFTARNWLYGDDANTTNVSIAAGGLLEIEGGTWRGLSDASATVNFYLAGTNYGTISGDASFTNAGNYGPISGNATFNDSSFNEGSVNGTATFNDTSLNNGGTYGSCIGNDGLPDGVGCNP